MGTIINPTPAATMLEEQRLGYIGCSLTNFDNTAEPQIVGNFEIAGSLASFPSAESITGWSGLSNGDVYIKVVPDTGAGTVAAEFTATAPTWNGTKQGWYGTGGSANHRYLFKLEKTGASGYEDKRRILQDGSISVNGDIDLTGSISGGGDAVFNALESTGAEGFFAPDIGPAITQADIYSTLDKVLPNVGDKCHISASKAFKSVTFWTHITYGYAERDTASSFRLKGVTFGFELVGSTITPDVGSVNEQITNTASNWASGNADNTGVFAVGARIS